MEKRIEFLIHGGPIMMDVHIIRQQVLRVDSTSHPRRSEEQAMPRRPGGREGRIVHRVVVIFIIVGGRVLFEGEVAINAQWWT